MREGEWGKGIRILAGRNGTKSAFRGLCAAAMGLAAHCSLHTAPSLGEAGLLSDLKWNQ